MTEHIFLDFYEFKEGSVRKVAEKDITEDTVDELEKLYEIQEMLGREPRVRRENW